MAEREKVDHGGTTQEGEELILEQIIRVDKKQTPIRIDKFLVDKLEKVSRNKIQLAIKEGLITVNGNRVKPNYRVKPQNQIKVVFPKEPVQNYVTPEDIPLDIVYEDDHLLVVNKPAGMVVHPGVAHYSGTLANALAYHVKSKKLPILAGSPMDRPGLVHRIDKDTSGLLVVAKSEEALIGLAKQFYHHTVYRRYWALVWGEPDPPEGTIIRNVGKDPKVRTRMRVFEHGEMGKYALTHYKVIEPLYYVSLVECRLETGRTHQIRVHMKYLGHTLFNDKQYGGNRILKGTPHAKYKQFVENCFKILPRQALHAKSLGFVHPITKEYMQFESDLPMDMQRALEKWRKYVYDKRNKMEV